MKKILMLALVVLLAASTFLGGCSQPSESEDVFINIGSGASGAVYYMIAAGMANAIQKEHENYKVSVETSDGSFQNIRMVGNEQIDFGITGADPLINAFEGVEDFENEKYENLRYVCTGHSSFFHIITESGSPINNFMDLKGKRVTVTAGGTTDRWFPHVLDVHGMTMNDIRVNSLLTGEMFSALKDGHADVAAWVGGIPASAIVDYCTTQNAKWIEIADIDKLVEKYPYYHKSVIPKGTYPKQDFDYPTVATANIFITHKDVPDEVVYNIVKAIMENNDVLLQAHPSAGFFNIENAMGSPVIPLHPGAEKYFKEKGIID